MKQERRFLVTGCARSGTKFIQTVWRKAGVDIGHEQVGGEACSSNFFAVDVPLYPKRRRELRFHDQERKSDYVFMNEWHQVRHPLGVISSNILVMSVAHRTWLSEIVPQLDDAYPKELFCMLYWLYWNQVCEKHADFTYKVEELDKHWGSMNEKAGLTRRPLPVVDKQTNRRLRWAKPFVDREAAKKKPDLTWQELEDIDPLVTRDIIQLAQHYGYETP